MNRILNLLLFGLICLGCFPAYAQKETKEKTDVVYILHPKFPLEKASLTYKVIIDNPFVNKLNIDQAWVNGLKIDGLQKSENPERIVKLEVYDLVDTSYVYNKVMEGNTYSWISKASTNIRLYITDPTDNSVYYEFKLNNYPQASKEQKAKSNF